ncbi:MULTISPECIES: UDP-N-acetylglucosamine 1-carboxyvinyltransferase [unclassified Neorhizobium]|uniref:UDP-N-acetylglucosamine 1-carboxyvinyltransferase n=1 Tax=unclassified Neorhizobium TaxID=2629175 RepID=UPI001FF16792|nr:MULTISPECIES: UDP-N-acetylglucosamine 1-carboxyvinyltransferase [unclassified Neorhizobium]MCJ9668984.1 UDP-N-acetylglucosamine 1-carboxyvinyltransferase [Neorhizobium sp. SHOUNA12B]MCJ9744938.1 UDP-N-acetylglucosamine 1-carboxyvinyltransferase [Neorhizobium sp. SHOUNA12A]
MADLVVEGGIPINGRLTPSGSKNAILPMLCATLLTDQEVTLKNVPDISDVEKILDCYKELGASVEWHRDEQVITVRHDADVIASRDPQLPLGIRSAVLLLAPIIQRKGYLMFDTEAKGCALGIRELDPHFDVLAAFGCSISTSQPREITLSGRPRAADIWAEYASVTATETFLMMAVLADGRSTLNNAASEPHVQEFCQMLTAMGGNISGIGTSYLVVQGVDKLQGVAFDVPDDHHEVATFLAIGGVSGGRIAVKTNVAKYMPLIIRQYRKLGLKIVVSDDEIVVDGWDRNVEMPLTPELVPKIEAAPWPYYPADLLPQAIGIAVGCNSEIMFWNKVYEGALSWSAELSKFGARVHLSDPHRLIVLGGSQLRPATVEAPYIIRVVLGLFIAAIQIKGQSTIRHADPIRRAHPLFVEKLQAMGCRVRWT